MNEWLFHSWGRVCRFVVVFSEMERKIANSWGWLCCVSRQQHWGRGVGVGWYFWWLDVRNSLWLWWNPVQLWFQSIPSGSQESCVINPASNLWQCGVNLNLTAKGFWPGDLPESSARGGIHMGSGGPEDVQSLKHVFHGISFSLLPSPLRCPLTSPWAGWHHWHFWAVST